MAQHANGDSLDAVIERTTAALSLASRNGKAPWHFARCWLLLNRYEENGRSTVDLDGALADFEALPEGAPGRARLAAVLTNAQLRTGMLTQPDRFSRALRLTAIANLDPEPLPDWPPTAAVMRAFALMYEGMNGAENFSVREAKTELEKLAVVASGTQPQATIVELARLVIRHLAAAQTGNLSEHEALAREMPLITDQLRASGISTVHIEVVTTALVAQSAVARGDFAKAKEQTLRLREILAGLAPGEPIRGQIEGLLSSVEPLMAQVMPGFDAPLSPEVKTAAPLSPQDEAMQENTTGTQLLASGADSPGQLAKAIGHLRRAVTIAPDHDPRRSHYLMALGIALTRRYELVRERPELLEAIRLLEQARLQAGSEIHSVWTLCANPLAHAYRLDGRWQLSRATALGGLRGHTWMALLQSQTTDATIATRHAAQDAIDVARWFLDDGDDEGAARALDAGRALTLYAAGQSRDLSQQLLALGQTQLAEKWREAVGKGGLGLIPADLQHEVMTALGGVEGSDASSSRLLDPPTLHEIRAALVTLDYDALVYLVPGELGSGTAVIVSARDAASHLSLPGLSAAQAKRMDLHMATTSRDLAPKVDLQQTRDLTVRSRRSLQQICEWAWTEAIEPVIRHVSTLDGRLPRLALIPMGDLSRIPWHAATWEEGNHRGYAVSRAVFSYALSGRMLCEAAWRTSVPLTASGLIVADPETDPPQKESLFGARAEAQAIWQAFYPDALYHGRAADPALTPDGAGTAAEIKAWLADVSAGPMIHLAVHGMAVSPAEQASPSIDESSYLLLGGPDGRLVAETIVNALAFSPQRALAMAVLAGCRTGEPTRSFDEAFSIGTALLVSGVRTVISSQWSVPDGSSSILMFLFHHFLRARGLAPLDALHEAQLAMIGSTPLPVELPEVLRSFAAADAMADILSWAGFTHSGK